jgi:putative membrane protein
VAVLLAVVGLGYLAGIARLLPHVHARRELAWRAACFAGGWAALALALFSPLDAAANRSFAMHMIQHETLMLIAAPLLVLGRGLPTLLWAMPRAARLVTGRATHAVSVRGSWTVLTSPVSAWLLHAAALWIWHIPPLFNAALTDGALHDWQHATFLATALIFWHSLLRHQSEGKRGIAVVSLFTTTLHTGILGAMLTFARTPLYAPLDHALITYGSLTPLEDQQLGGLIMWVPGALVYVGAALALLANWLTASTRTAEELH